MFHEIMLLALREPEKYNLIVLHKYSRQAQGLPRWIGYIGEGLRKGIKAGRLRPMNPDRGAFSIWSSFLGFNLMVSRSPGLTPEEAEALFQTQVQIMIGGLLRHGKNQHCIRNDDQTL